MNETAGWDEEYIVGVAAYQKASPGTDAANDAAKQILGAAEGLLRKAVAESVDKEDELFSDAMAAAREAVLSMALEFDEKRNITFAQWLKYRKSPWRAAVSEGLEDWRNGARLKVPEKKALSVARGVSSAYFEEHGHWPSDHEVVTLVQKAVEANEAEDETSAARNLRSGFTAAVRDLPELLAGSRTPLHPDTAGSEGEDMWDLIAVETEHDKDDLLAILAGLSGAGLPGKKNKEERMNCAHAQWAWLAG